MTLANRITILRIVLIPVFATLYLQEANYPALKYWTLGVFAFAILTDLLDGLAARMRKEKTQLGSFLDPLADKLLLISTFGLLAYSERFPLWVLVIFLSRDMIILLGWTILYILTSSSNVAPRFLGKLCTFSQMTCSIAFLFPVVDDISKWILRVTILFTVLSTIDYILVGSKRLELISD